MSKKVFYDQMGNKITIPHLPRRILSLVPSQTELLSYLGLDEEVVGITKFCIHPEHWWRTKMRVGGTKKLDMAKINRLQPDIIIGNKEENTREQIEELMSRYPVWMSDIHNLDDALAMIKSVGALVGKEKKAKELTSLISKNFKNLSALKNRIHKYPSGKQGSLAVAYFIWRKPYMTAGKDTFISSMMERCGFNNVFGDLPDRYPVVTPLQIERAEPELILLSTEPYPFAEQHIAEFRGICPDAHIMRVDGEYFSWYGSRLADSPQYLIKVIEDAEHFVRMPGK